MKHINILLLTAVVLLPGCKDYLSVTPDKSLVVPQTVTDLQALLEKSFMYSSGPSGMVLGADNYYLEYDTWQSWYHIFRNSYIWAPDTYVGTSGSSLDWGHLYKIVYSSNIILEGLKNISTDSRSLNGYNLTKGMALFYRAFAYFGLAQDYALPYSESSATTDLGLPLRLTSDLDRNLKRSSVEDTYQQIIHDLMSCVRLLPDAVEINHLNRPSKPAVFALLSRVFLSMRDYKRARLYADSSLRLEGDLLEYSTVDLGLRFPFTEDNPEIILQSYIETHATILMTHITTKLADTALYRSYGKNDLRKIIFFSENDQHKPYYSASYSGNVALFNGLATDEMYLTRAECAARMGDINAALRDLNRLLVSRWKKGKYIPYIEMSQERLLEIILSERRKELVFRGLRWTDLRRLNQEEGHKTTLKRVLNDKTYSLPPGDRRYVYPIPDDEVRLTGIDQNER